MKLLHITYHFQFADAVEEILNDHGVGHFVRMTMVQSRDRNGRHYGSKVFPGSSDLVQALVEDNQLEDLLQDLEDFRNKRESHRHLEVLVLGVERRLGDDSVRSEE